MKAIRHWMARHPTATLRIITIGLAALCLWRAIAAQGSPEGSVILGCVAIILCVIASADIDTESSTRRRG